MKQKTYLSAWFEAVHLRDELKEKGLVGSFDIEHDRLNKIVTLYHSKKEYCNPLDVKYTKKIASYPYGIAL